MTDRPRFDDEEDDRAATISSRSALPMPLREVLRVVVTEGPDAGAEFTLDPDAPSRTLVGTSPACAIKLTDPTVSRRHAAFEYDEPRFHLVDLRSTNGTSIEGVAVRDAYVHAGQTLRFGGTTMRVDAKPDARAAPLPSAGSFGLVIGASPVMRRLYPLAERVARARVPVIIEGETGTGKEVFAESLHEVGGARGPFVVFDCTTVSPQLMESELFGHERGAFTGAIGARTGVFEEANGGTLLIDEIGDLDLPLQAKLLRVIDRGELRRVGGKGMIKVDVRIMAATRRDLDKAVAEGKFRDDLFHRLAIARLELPPLRERAGDIALLVRHFALQLTGSSDGIPPHVVARFEAYSWPGNVRELRNACARHVALGELPTVPGAALGSPPASASMPPPPGDSELVSQAELALPFQVARRRALARFERAYVDKLVAAHGGNVNQAARASGLATRYFRLVKARALRDD